MKSASTLRIRFRICSVEFCLSMLLIFGLFLAPKCWGQNDFEAKLKTAYLINMANFVTWPANTSYVSLCINKQSHLFKHLSELSPITLGNGNRLWLRVNPGSLELCNILYWDRPSQEAFNNIISTRHEGLLIISDMNNALESGSAIQLYIRNLKLRFAFNSEAINHSNYTVSSKLLRLSRQVD